VRLRIVFYFTQKMQLTSTIHYLKKFTMMVVGKLIDTIKT